MDLAGVREARSGLREKKGFRGTVREPFASALVAVPARNDEAIRVFTYTQRTT
jgi:hypothetical protein